MSKAIICTFSLFQVLLVYPADTAITLKELAEKLTNSKSTTCTDKPNGTSHDECQRHAETGVPPEPKRTKYCDQKGVKRFDRVVFIDSTWNQSNQIFRDERLQGKEEWAELGTQVYHP